MGKHEFLESKLRNEMELLRESGRDCHVLYPQNIYPRLYNLGYKCKDDAIEIDELFYPIKFFHKEQRIGKLKKQNILSVFIFGYMPETVDDEFFKLYMRGLDRMISTYTDFSTAKWKAGMSLCISQDEMTDYIARYCVLENSVNAFLGNIPLCYETSTNRLYVKIENSRMPAHYAMHLDDLNKVFFQ